MDIQMDNHEAIRRIEDHMRIHELNEPRAVLINVALDKAIQALRDQRPEGTWIVTWHNDLLGRWNNWYEYKCSVCKHWLHKTSEVPGDNYCPNCGAKMTKTERIKDHG